MAESSEHQHVSRPRLALAGGGFLGTIAILVIVTLVIVDKPRFGALVGSRFLQTVVGGLLLAAVVMLFGAFTCARGYGWRKTILITWALTGLCSPAFGWIIMLPWAAMIATLPVVIAAFYGLWQRTR